LHNLKNEMSTNNHTSINFMSCPFFVVLVALSDDFGIVAFFV
jgi:hypothetical protein